MILLIFIVSLQLIPSQIPVWRKIPSLLLDFTRFSISFETSIGFIYFQRNNLHPPSLSINLARHRGQTTINYPVRTIIKIGGVTGVDVTRRMATRKTFNYFRRGSFKQEGGEGRFNVHLVPFPVSELGHDRSRQWYFIVKRYYLQDPRGVLHRGNSSGRSISS